MTASTSPDLAPIHPESAIDFTALAAELRTVREEWRRAQERHVEYGDHGFPSRHALARVVDQLGATLFPIRLGPPELTPDSEDAFVVTSLATALPLLTAQVRMELAYSRAQGAPDGDLDADAARIIARLAARLPHIRRVLDTDLEAAYAGDPAARSVDEVLLCYPGVTAIMHHRIAHELYLLGAPLVARILAEVAHSRTGIDIHPGARIGDSFFIDHGTGVVIGQTAIIGDRVRIYQAVTLGARSFRTDEAGNIIKDEPRHPIVEDDVTIYSGATVLGRIVIGKGSVIGGNVWITSSIPPGSRVRQHRPTIEIEAADPFA
ncbi:serine O-acetyltransferase EpsC [Novosphingobium colocasiae]|uniref:serine O-acetyltransferase EpsC n=1 Tax=Novosphingobium colocasiae TaxID=1256513 RepID=UPI0035B20FAF